MAILEAVAEQSKKSKIYEFPSRVDGRSQSQMRPLLITAGMSPHSEGSAEVALGSTRVLITASFSRNCQQTEGEAILARIQMLPQALGVATDDPVIKETLEKQLERVGSLIVRALSAAIKKEDLNGHGIILDCSILCSDSGVGTAAVAGSWVALYQALRWAANKEIIRKDIYVKQVAAISGGILEGRWLIDLLAKEAMERISTVGLHCPSIKHVLQTEHSMSIKSPKRQ